MASEVGACGVPYRIFPDPGAEILGETQRKNMFVMFALKANGLPAENFDLVCCPKSPR
jgi:hypothetical protein